MLYGAGSLREAMAQIATTFGSAHGVTVTTQFGPSRQMCERIENELAPGVRVGVDANGVVSEQRLYQLVRQACTITDRTFEILNLDPVVQA